MSDVETINDSAEQEPSGGLRPQLRLHHFFVLTAVAAALLAASGPQQDWWAGNPGFQPPRIILQLMMVWVVIHMLLVAVAVTAVGYGIAWRRKGIAFFDQPGHWLLVEVAMAGLAGVVPGIAMRWSMGTPQPVDFQNVDQSTWIILCFIWGFTVVFMVLVPVALNIYVGLKKCRELRWSLLFYFKAMARFFMGFGDLLVLPFTLFVAGRDYREGIPRDGGHWCGVFVQCALSAVTIGGIFLSLVNAFSMFPG
jgi:hypothetical protein